MQCYLCPGNSRTSGDKTPDFSDQYVFVNDFSAVNEEQPSDLTVKKAATSHDLLRAESVSGKCLVVIFNPLHNLTLADLSRSQITDVISVWSDLFYAYMDVQCFPRMQKRDLKNLSSKMDIAARSKIQYRYMQIFENKGAAMGCSSPHPHGQIWITSSLPDEPTVEGLKMREYREGHEGAHLLRDYVQREVRQQERVVFENAAFVILCPWWATWPFETTIIPKEHKRALVDLSAPEISLLAEAVQEITRRYDNLFNTIFPYAMGIHQAPLTGRPEEIDSSYLHIHWYPPLLRSATVKKFLVGYEMLAEPQRDITPEQAAKRLRECGGPLYRTQQGDQSSVSQS